jgi:hypothetical protein
MTEGTGFHRYPLVLTVGGQKTNAGTVSVGSSAYIPA